jgi:hypothetical protein
MSCKEKAVKGREGEEVIGKKEETRELSKFGEASGV